MASLTQGLVYPFDPTGKLASNLIVNEQQTLTASNWGTYHFIVPNLAPYFGESLQIKYKDLTGVEKFLVQGVDWFPTHEFIAASRACASPINGSISFMNSQLAGTITLTYQTLGGIWTQDQNSISQILADHLHNPRTTAWDQVVDMPVTFPVIDHEWDLVDMVGASDIVTSLQAIEAQLRQSGQQGLADHIANVNNPHKVTKAQVGLDQVANYRTATNAEAITGTNGSVYITAANLGAALAAGPNAGLSTHLADFTNPHKTTAAQVGAYSTVQSDNLLAQKLGITSVAYDTDRFNGMGASAFAAWVLQGTAANAITVYGMTLDQLRANIQGGASANALMFNGYTYDQAKADFLSGVAAAAATFGGKNPTDYANWILGQTANNALNFGGRTPAQFTSDVLSGTASNASQFNGKSYEQVRVDFMGGTAANAAQFGGQTPAQFLAQISSSVKAADSALFNGQTPAQFTSSVLAGTANNSSQLNGQTLDQITATFAASTVANSLKFGGMTPDDWVKSLSTTISSSGAVQNAQTATTGESVGSRWIEIGQVLFPTGASDLALFADAQWFVAGGESSTGGVASGLYYLRVSSRTGTKANPALTLNFADLSGASTGAKFGYTIESMSYKGTVQPVGRIWMQVSENHSEISVTEVSKSNGDGAGGITINGTPVVIAPANIQYVTVGGTNIAAASDLAQLRSDVTDGFNQLATAFQNLQTALGQ